MTFDFDFTDEYRLSPQEAKQELQKLLLYTPLGASNNSVSAVAIAKAREYDLSGSLEEQMRAISDESINRMMGVEGNFEYFTREAIHRINGDYLGKLIDASYSQNTMAPDVVAQGIGASEQLNGNVFTTNELLETGEYIANKHYEMFNYVAKVEVDNKPNAGNNIAVEFSEVIHDELVEAVEAQEFASAIDDLDMGPMGMNL